MLHTIAGKSTQNFLRFGSAKAESRSKFDHLVILLPNEIPFDGSGQDLLEVGIGIGLACFWAVELLRVDVFEAW
jgi:hypothetical protein